ncbi:MAG: hypothetical protein ABSC01_11285 [Verrucomicrobiota bacterium]|jgi:hypothetical protein
MTTTTAKKRLEEIETYLTPKEWAIRLADEMRKYPDGLSHIKALVKLPLRELPVQRPFYAFEKQAGERNPDDEPEDIRARNRLTDALWCEFHTLKLLIRQVNDAMQRKIEIIGLQAALQFTALHGIILREALDGFPSPLAEWSHELTALLKGFFAHLAAVELVQDEYFDGHPILYPELEAELTEATRTIESAVATANEYLNRRAKRDGAETNAGAGESPLAITLESIKASVNGQRAAAVAEKWMHDASREAVGSDEERWERCREELLAKE